MHYAGSYKCARNHVSETTGKTNLNIIAVLGHRHQQLRDNYIEAVTCRAIAVFISASLVGRVRRIRGESCEAGAWRELRFLTLPCGVTTAVIAARTPPLSSLPESCSVPVVREIVMKEMGPDIGLIIWDYIEAMSGVDLQHET